jgi:hypothetical protein
MNTYNSNQPTYLPLCDSDVSTETELYDNEQKRRMGISLNRIILFDVKKNKFVSRMNNNPISIPRAGAKHSINAPLPNKVFVRYDLSKIPPFPSFDVVDASIEDDVHA